jgi:hypothetical protein
MVTPSSLYGAGCATAGPAVTVNVNNKAANTAVFMAASLSSLHSPVEPAMRRERYQRAGVRERLAGRNRRAAATAKALGIQPVR